MIKSLWKWIAIGLIFSFLALFVFPEVVISVAKEFGYLPVPSVGVSMEPTIPPGSLIFVKTENFVCNVGDICCYEIPSDKCSANPYIAGKGTWVCHRVIDKKDGTYLFKGDNPKTNPEPDPCWIREDYLIGKYAFHIPYLGSHLIALNYYSYIKDKIQEGYYI